MRALLQISAFLCLVAAGLALWCGAFFDVAVLLTLAATAIFQARLLRDRS